MASQLNKEDLCVLQCALIEAIGLSSDQRHESDDPAERRGLDANIATYRRVLAKVRAMESAPSVKPVVSVDIADLNALGDLVRGRRHVVKDGYRAYFADTSAEDREWKRMCALGLAQELGSSVYRTIP